MNINRTDKSGLGAAGFTSNYWQQNYAQPQTMDGIYNARRRAVALKALFDSEYIEINTVVDLGFGLGVLLKEILDQFIPLTVVGIEPSAHAYAKVHKADLTDIETMNVDLQQTDILSWCQSPCHLAPFDLGICTSVFQYLTDPEIEKVLPILAKRLRYFYFSVPIDSELQFQADTLSFDDRYAISRSREEYRSMLSDHFTIVSNRLLESNVYFDEESTQFTDFLYRF